MQVNLTVYVIQRDSVFLAQAAEHDISVQAKSMDLLMKRFEIALDCELMESMARGDQGLLSGLPPPPQQVILHYECELCPVDNRKTYDQYGSEIIVDFVSAA